MEQGYHDLINNVVHRTDGSVAFINPFGSVTVSTPSMQKDSWSIDAARKAITDMDKKIKRRHVPEIGRFR